MQLNPNIFKYPGNKIRLVPLLSKIFPKRKEFHEPFCGSIAASNNLKYSKYVLSDTNHLMINFFKTLKASPIELIENAEKFFVCKYQSEKQFYQLRDLMNKTSDSMLQASLLPYMNYHCFNGLMRLNPNTGFFNVPYGGKRSTIYPRAALLKTAERIHKMEFHLRSFEKSMIRGSKHRCHYVDPPYFSISNGFSSYTGKFGEDEHSDLAERAERLSKQGSFVVISNHDNDFTRQIYKNASIIIELDVQRNISATKKGRKKVKELLAVYGEPGVDRALLL